MTDLAAFPGAAIIVALACVPLLAPAQDNAQDLERAAADLDCAQLATMPNPPMSVETCEAQKAAFGRLGAAVNTRGGARPGDAAMTCAQIVAELQASDFRGVGAQTAAEGAAAGEELRGALASTRASAAGMAARHGVETAAASAGPNAVQGGVAMQHEAEQAALRRSATAGIRSAEARTGLANAASAQELAAGLEANPRAATLMQLAMARNCEVP